MKRRSQIKTEGSIKIWFWNSKCQWKYLIWTFFFLYTKNIARHSRTKIWDLWWNSTWQSSEQTARYPLCSRSALPPRPFKCAELTSRLGHKNEINQCATKSSVKQLAPATFSESFSHLSSYTTTTEKTFDICEYIFCVCARECVWCSAPEWPLENNAAAEHSAESLACIVRRHLQV